MKFGHVSESSGTDYTDSLSDEPATSIQRDAPTPIPEVSSQISSEDNNGLWDYEVSLSDDKIRRDIVNSLVQQYPDFKITLAPDEMPVNWSTKKRLLHTIAYGITTFSAQFGATMISPNGAKLAKQFNVGREVTTLVFSIYVLGNMVGPMIFAPLSEVAGRKIGVFVPCFLAGIWLCCSATVSNIWALMVYRFFAGVFAAAPIVSSGGALGDLWTANERAAAMVLYALCIFTATSTAPTFGALLDISGSYGWRWVCWLSGLLQMIIPSLNMIFLSESFAPVLERRKARNLRHETGVWSIHADLDAWKLTAEEFIKVHCMRPILMLVTPVLFLLILYTSFVYGLLFLAIATVGYEFQAHEGASFVASYCPLMAFFFGFASGGMINILNSRRYAKIGRANGGIVAPEERLVAMMLFGWFMPCGLFIYGWTMRPSIHWFVPTLGIGFMGGGIAVIFQGSLVYMVDCYTKFAASAIAANTFMRSIFGGVMPLFALQMYNSLGVGWASSLLGFVGIALWPCSWLFYFYGERLRKIEPFGDLLH